MLGKFLGGIAAVFGVTIMVVILTRQPQVRFKETLGLLLLAGAGLAVFPCPIKGWLDVQQFMRRRLCPPAGPA